MSKTGSFIKIDRGLKNNAIWLEKPFSKGQAWVDLLILTQGMDRDVMIHGQVQHQESGKVYISITHLSDRWGWSRNKIYRFLNELKNAGMLDFKGLAMNGTTDGTRDGTYYGTVITIENWALYQYDGTENGTMNRTGGCVKNGTYNRKKQEKDKEKEKKKRGRFAPQPPSGEKPRIPDRDVGTADDIPAEYRERFTAYADYWDWRNQ